MNDPFLEKITIDWDSKDTEIMLNPRLESRERKFLTPLFRYVPVLPGHIWIQSSGSTQFLNESSKWIALSKQAFLISAQAVNEHLESTRTDKWGVALPLFHVGGLSIYARAFLSGASLAEYTKPWNADSFYEWLNENQITLLSLVPTQLFDLVKAGHRAPKSLRAVVIGGAKLESKLAQQAWVLGWPVLASFGMTELCSQIATASLNSTFSDDLRVLGHVDVKTESDGLLQIKSDALMTGYGQVGPEGPKWVTPELKGGYWKTKDQAQVKTRTNLKTAEIEIFLSIKGRVQDFVKVKGEGIDMAALRSRFFDWALTEKIPITIEEYTLIDLAHERDGAKLVLAAEAKSQVKWDDVLKKWNGICFPLERLELRKIEKLPRSPVGKVLTEKLRESLKASS